MEPYDTGLFRTINNGPEAFAPLMRFFSEATNYPWFKVLAVVLVVALLIRKGAGARVAVQGLVAFPLANGITDLFKYWIPEARPFQELSSVLLRAGWSDSAGTASAHSANMAAIAFVAVYHLRWWGAPWILFAILTGISRSYNGVHYPHQVLLGWMCGAFSGWLICRSWDAIIASCKKSA